MMKKRSMARVVILGALTALFACRENAADPAFAPTTNETPIVVAQPSAAPSSSDAARRKPSPPSAPLVVGPRRGPVGDRDGDGIPDDVDACPSVPEDFDGFEDDDGCPEGDNDGDGIPDAQYRCPNEPETFNGIQDDDGCPDRTP